MCKTLVSAGAYNLQFSQALEILGIYDEISVQEINANTRRVTFIYILRQ